ncbi:MAG: HlyD family efflux transporter periplasmic adaptor subunit, partial [Planctomycetota bacterium]
VIRAEAALDQARLDLARTELWAPFGAEVSGRSQNVGGYASPGSPVVHLTMIDPIEVAVQVSAATSREIAVNDRMRVFVDGLDEPIDGKVIRKSSSADAGTQTFTVTAICRNMYTQDEGDDSGAIRVADVFQPQRERVDGDGPLFVEERQVLRRDDDGWFVWAFDGWKVPGPPPDELVLRRVPVTPGERRLNYLGTFVLRSLDASTALDPRQLLGMNVPADAKDGDRAVLATSTWAMRPGDVVRVDIGIESTGPGYFVPQEAVVLTGPDSARVYMIGEDGTAKGIDITAGPVTDGMQQIFGEQLDSLPAGTRVITTGAAGVRDGERVRVVGGEG